MIKRNKKVKRNNIILASGSPRRKEILSQVGLEFDVIVSDVDEVITQSEPKKIVLELSMQKAEDVYTKVLKERFDNALLDTSEGDKHVIIAADTVVEVDNKIMGKPSNRDEAYDMIKLIQGRKHNVLTGVTLIVCDGVNKPRKIAFYESTEVEIYDMSDEEINKYIDSGESFDKAGGYAVQGLFAAYVKGLNGDYYNVVGLPISRIIREFKSIF
jgi:septum formation protein